MKEMHRVFATVIACVLIAAGSVAHAGDTKVYPATMCALRAGVQPIVDVDGTLWNNFNNNGVNLVCPIVRDNTTKPYVSVKVIVIDQHPTQNVFCVVHANHPSGSPNHDTSVLFSSGDSPLPQTLNFGPIEEFDGGSYTLSCGLPPFGSGPSKIASYVVTE